MDRALETPVNSGFHRCCALPMHRRTSMTAQRHWGLTSNKRTTDMSLVHGSASASCSSVSADSILVLCHDHLTSSSICSRPWLSWSLLVCCHTCSQDSSLTGWSPVFSWLNLCHAQASFNTLWPFSTFVFQLLFIYLNKLVKWFDYFNVPACLECYIYKTNRIPCLKRAIW